MRFLNKRGQGAGPVAVFIFVLALLIVLYVLFIPEAARNELIDFGSSSGGSNGGSSSGGDSLGEVLLDESPGYLTPQGEDDFVYNLDSVSVFATTDAQSIKKINPFVIENGWFNDKNRTLTFTVNNIDLIDNVLLTFNAREKTGILSISLNGENIFEQRVSQYNVPSITLQKEFLEEGENTLDFTVDGVGGAFWKTHRYGIENMEIVGDVTDVSRQQSENLFVIPDSRGPIETASLEFVPECIQDEVGVLKVYLNGRQVFSGVPDCGRLNTRDLPPRYLSLGSNDLVFETEKGTYQLDRIEIETELEDRQFPTYYFTINEDQVSGLPDDVFDDYVARGDARLEVRVENEDGEEVVDARVEVDGIEEKVRITDSDGEAVFFLRADDYEIRVSKDGEVERKNVRLEYREDELLSVVLDVDAEGEGDDELIGEGKLIIRVHDEDGDEIEDARVEVESDDYDDIERTDETGKVIFYLEPDRYDIEVSKGSEEETDSVRINEGEVESLRFFLDADFDNDNDDSTNYYRGEDKVTLKLNFVVPETHQIEMRVSVNNNQFGIFQHEETFERDITEFLQEGNNFIRLIPEETVEVVNLRLIVEDRDD